MLSLIRTVFVLACVMLPSFVLADFHFDAKKKNVISDEDMALAAEITEFLADYETAYNNQDYRTVKSMWSGDGNPIYMAEEVPFPLYGQSRLDGYFNPRPGRKILDGIDNRYSEVRAKYVAPGVVTATYRLDYDIKLVGMPASHGWNRIMAVFVKVNDEWKMSAYTESPMGPATMVRKMMKANPAVTDAEKVDYATTKKTIKMLSQAGVPEGFDAFLEERKDLQPVH